MEALVVGIAAINSQTPIKSVSMFSYSEKKRQIRIGTTHVPENNIPPQAH